MLPHPISDCTGSNKQIWMYSTKVKWNHWKQMEFPCTFSKLHGFLYTRYVYLAETTMVSVSRSLCLEILLYITVFSTIDDLSFCLTTQSNNGRCFLSNLFALSLFAHCLLMSNLGWAAIVTWSILILLVILALVQFLVRDPKTPVIS